MAQWLRKVVCFVRSCPQRPVFFRWRRKTKHRCQDFRVVQINPQTTTVKTHQPPIFSLLNHATFHVEILMPSTTAETSRWQSPSMLKCRPPWVNRHSWAKGIFGKTYHSVIATVSACLQEMGKQYFSKFKQLALRTRLIDIHHGFLRPYSYLPYSKVARHLLMFILNLSQQVQLETYTIRAWRYVGNQS